MKNKTAELPPSHHARMDALELRPLSYLSVSQQTDDGHDEWLPRDIIGRDGKTVVVWRKLDGDYSFPGWEPWHDGMFGGRYDTIHNALAWVERARDIRAGRATDFLGV